jgi:hypothetical protein
MSNSDHRRRAGRLLGLVGAIATVAIVGTTAAGAVIHFSGDGDVDRGVQAILDAEFTGSCVTSASAVGDLNANLKAAGFNDWQVRSRTQGSECVAGGLDGSTSTIFLFAVQSPGVTDAMAGVKEDLMQRCMERSEAIDYVSSVLRAAGVADFEVRTDGPFAFPLGQQHEVTQHVAAGCYVYSLPGHAEDGTPIYYLSGIE